MVHEWPLARQSVDRQRDHPVDCRAMGADDRSPGHCQPMDQDYGETEEPHRPQAVRQRLLEEFGKLYTGNTYVHFYKTSSSSNVLLGIVDLFTYFFKFKYVQQKRTIT